MKTIGRVILLILAAALGLRTVDGACNVSNALGSSPIVKLTTGSVQGLSCQSVLGLSYYSFFGIPYAKPPLRSLRFRAPHPPKKWKTVLQAKEHPASCSQPARSERFPITYNEDCLYINVFTPHIKHPSIKLLPVMVWIHGGKYYQGSSSVHKYGPDFLLEKEVILVTFNYRLGVFGYLNMNIPGAQGNVALKDKVAALKWVKREIHNFGGDPDLVTICGGSSGAGAVNLLYLSPMSRGLFSRAISHSGSALEPWPMMSSNTLFAYELAKAIGCDSPESAQVVDCFRRVDATELAEKQMMFKGVYGVDEPFLPTLESDQGEEIFLADHPRELFKHSPAIPYIIGVNSGEGLMYIEDPDEMPDQFTNIGDKMLRDNLPGNIVEYATPSVVRQVVSMVRRFYFFTARTLETTAMRLVNFFSDRQFIHGVLKSSTLLSRRTKVYLYYFTFEGEFQAKSQDYYKLDFALPGVCHGEELGYFFYRNSIVAAHNNLSAYPQDMNMMEHLTTLWTRFATYGDPTSIQPKDRNTTWLPVFNSTTRHLYIGDDIHMVEKPLLEARAKLWDDIYSLVYSEEPLILTARSHVFFHISALHILYTITTFGICLYIYTYVNVRRNSYTELK